jgi:hypothetical protein
MIMKKLFAVAILAVTFCLTGLVMSGEAQAERFVDNGNGTVTDTQTGLMWTKNANMFGELTWYDAMARCGSFSISGIGGWRMPSKDELKVFYQAIQGGHPFTGVQSWYWSSTTLERYSDPYKDFAWTINMNDGEVSYHAHRGYPSDHAWPVRTAQ